MRRQRRESWDWEWPEEKRHTSIAPLSDETSTSPIMYASLTERDICQKAVKAAPWERSLTAQVPRTDGQIIES